MPEFAAIIPTAPGREENLTAVLECLVTQTVQPKLIVLVCDGEEAWIHQGMFSLPTVVANIPKHQPGAEQPRNVGVRLVEKLRTEQERFEGITHAWFLDSDIIVLPDCLEQYVKEMEAVVRVSGIDSQRGIYYGPYEWLPPGVRQVRLDLRNDPRTEMFADHPAGVRYEGALNVGLGCFSGNLVWNIEDFRQVGGFWNELHHGRCEDGELGLRAVAMGIPMGLAPDARGWHLDHPRDMGLIDLRNDRDVPMINARHPWVEGEDLFVVEKDGKRFDVRCPCGWQGNTALMWAHHAECPGWAAP